MNNEMNNKAIKQKILGYYKLNTFIFIIEKLPNSYPHSYNGHIVETFEDIFVFKDRFLGDIVINYDSVLRVEPSELKEEEK